MSDAKAKTLEEVIAQRDEAIAQRDEAIAQRDEALRRFKEALRPMFSSNPDWNKLRRDFAWAKLAAHPGLAWPSEVRGDS